MNKMQEKFQQIAPRPAKGDNQWANFKNNRVVSRLKDVSYPDTPGETGAEGFTDKLENAMPPGMFIDNQTGLQGKFHPITLAGKTDEQNIREGSLNDKTLRNGFFLSKMSPVDDMYTNEHVDGFYDSVTVDGVEGFVERNNMLDRA